jgi:hypothetical protein
MFDFIGGIIVGLLIATAAAALYLRHLEDSWDADDEIEEDHYV